MSNTWRILRCTNTQGKHYVKRQRPQRNKKTQKSKDNELNVVVGSMLKHKIGITQNDHQVYGYLTKEPLAAVIARNPHLLSLIKETIATLDLKQKTEVVKRNMGRPIGYSELVATKPDDQVFYAQQGKDGPYKRYVKNRKPEPTSALSLELSKDQAGDYELHSVILGNQPPPFPENVDEVVSQSDREYWKAHAFVYNGQPIRANTLLKDWPF